MKGTGFSPYVSDGNKMRLQPPRETGFALSG